MMSRRAAPTPGRSARRSVMAVAAILGAGLVLSACDQGSTAQQPTQTAAASGASSQPASPSASPTPTLGPDPGVKVVWGNGRDVPGMSDGIPNPPDWYAAAFGQTFAEAKASGDKVIYLTYDDGPWPPSTQQILALLAKNDARATFFVVGAQVKQHPELIAKITAGGNAVGNHSQSHPELTGLDDAGVREQLASLQEELGTDIGACMRPPYGLLNESGAKVTKSLGLSPILWTGHAEDWSQPPVPAMVKMLKAATEPGAVILLHDGGGSRENTVAATAQMLPWWKEQGYRFGILPACETPATAS